MRIFELAKSLKVNSGDILRIARKNGVEATSTLSRLDDDDVKIIRSSMAKAATRSSAAASVASAKSIAAKRARAEAMRKEHADAEKTTLGSVQQRAREIEQKIKAEAAARKAAAAEKKNKIEAAPVPEKKPVEKAVEKPVEAVSEKPVETVPAAPAEKAEPAPVAPAPVAPVAPAKGKKAPEKKTEVSLKADDFRRLAPLPPAASDPKVIFHPAAQDDYDDEDDDENFSSRRDDDYESDEDLTRAYFGRRGTESSRHSQSRQRDDFRDEGGTRGGRGHDLRDSRDARGGQRPDARGGQRPDARGGQRPDARGGQRPDARMAQRPDARGGQRPDARGAQQRPGAPVARPQNNVFPTRPQNNVFPTRPQNNVFPTRPQNSAFPTRAPQNNVFPTRAPQGVANNLRGGQMPNGRLPQNGRGAQQNLKGQPRGGQKEKGQKMNNNGLQVAPPIQAVQNAPLVGDTTLTLRGPVLVRELAEMMNVRPNKLIADLMQHNQLISINQRVDLDMAGKIAERYGYKVTLERVKRSSERKPAIKRLDEEDDIPEDKPEDMKPRPPVVTFLGHVDHGKTSLLDYIRKSKVASGEAGGITQHIGAYSVAVNDRKITFLDTPGHAAFSAMRARGAKLTDIAVVVIAADDGIMPQTREVIKECRQANVQIMVAINKCDLPAAKPDRVRQQLQGEGLTPEEWGGDIVCCEVSAHTGQGMDNLLEMILLQADVLELQANPNRRADGYVIEAQMELGRGPTATLLVASGTLKQGDVVLIDEHYGRLRGLVDDRGCKVSSVGPAQAVRVMGLSGVPEAGAEFRVMTNEKRAKELAEKFAMERKAQELQEVQKSVSFDSIFDKMKENDKKQLSIIVKADTQGTVEAICDTLRDIRSEKITLEILGSSIGNINANDVQRAAAGKAMIVGFQVSSESGVAPIATHDGVRINTFRIIYELFDFVKQSMLDMLDPEYKEVVRGHAQIRQIFEIGKKGKIAGCQLLDGVVRKDALVRIKRAREVLFDGKISSLKHYKDEVAMVSDMQEFGISFVDFEDFAEGDVIECYAMEEMERTL